MKRRGRGVIFLLFLIFLNINLFADAHIFVYHRFGDNRYPSTNTSIKELKKEFEYLKKHNYKVISLNKLINLIKNKRDLDRYVVLTIDDGFKSFYENGLKIFKKYKYPFTLFIATKPIESGYRDFLSWSEVNECSQYGTIAFHSHTHPHLTHLSSEEIKEDTKKGMQIFEKHLGYKPKFYAYPYGEYDDRVKNIIKSFGFEAILNQNIGAVSKESDIYDLDRIALVGKSNIKRALKYRHLNALWIEPKKYPKDGILKAIKAKIFDNVSKAKAYITGYGWRDVEVKNGEISKNLNLKLDKNRVRVIIKVKNSKINTKILVKE